MIKTRRIVSLALIFTFCVEIGCAVFGPGMFPPRVILHLMLEMLNPLVCLLVNEIGNKFAIGIFVASVSRDYRLLSS